MKHRFWLVPFAVVLVVSALLAPFSGLMFNRVDSAYRNLRPGMTRAEVSAMLGCGPGDHGPGEAGVCIGTFLLFGEFCDDCRRIDHPDCWFGQSMCVMLRFDKDGRAVNAYYDHIVRPYESHWDLAFRRITLQPPRPLPICDNLNP